MDKLNIIFIVSNNEEHSSISKYNSKLQKVLYTSEAPATIVGNVKVDVIIDDIWYNNYYISNIPTDAYLSTFSLWKI